MGGSRGRGSWHVIIGWAVGIAGAVLLAAPSPAGLIITEIMYYPRFEPASEWEWVEVYNDGPTEISLKNWVLDDTNLSVKLSNANIAGGSIPAGGVAVLFNSAIGATAFTAAWGEGINLIPVTSWQGLNADRNDGSMLWANLAAYATNGLADVFLGYGVTGNWDTPVNGRSIYYTGDGPDPMASVNWNVSVAGVDGAYTSASYDDVGSPGVVPLPEPAASVVLALTALATLGRRARLVDHRSDRRAPAASAG